MQNATVNSRDCLIYTGHGNTTKCRRSEMVLDKKTTDLDSVLASIFESAKYVTIRDAQSCRYDEKGKSVCKDVLRLSIIEYE
jgi:hypothetical protein